MVITIIQETVNTLLNLVYFNGDNCIYCKNEIYENYLCKQCLNKLMIVDMCKILDINGVTVKCYSSLFYDGIVKKIIKDLKYKSQYNRGRIVSKYMIETLKKSKEQYDLVTYVPMYKKDERIRGFNQSKLIAQLIHKKKCKKILLKNKSTKNQKCLNEEERWKNLKECFSINNNVHILGKSILLVDDVFTSGATVKACSEILINNGAKEVVALTAATGILKKTQYNVHSKSK